MSKSKRGNRIENKIFTEQKRETKDDKTEKAKTENKILIRKKIKVTRKQ